MFWVDAELGSDIYLDGKLFLTTQCVFISGWNALFAKCVCLIQTGFI